MSSLSVDEIKLLEQGLPRLADLSSNILIPFEVRRLRHARVVWINDRWFLQRGLDVTSESVHQRLVDWICNEFGYAAPRPGDPTDGYAEATKTFFSDRYGSSDPRTQQGGSGRAAVVGCFQVKGVGITPLVGEGTNWTHSHGCASLEEAVREAVYGEVFAAEFPHGAVPIVAIIDAGICFSRPSPELAEEAKMRRAIVVRPVVLRPAHVERASLFRRSVTGYKNSQLDDVQRCRDMMQHWVALARNKKTSIPDVPGILSRIAEQIAFGQVQRLFSGGYFSSNLTIEGALLDFGASRSLPNWANAKALHNVPGFGDEMRIVREVIRSLVFHFNKYSGTSVFLSEAILIAQTAIAYERAFSREVLRIWGQEDTADQALKEGIVEAVKLYFSSQQKLQVNYRIGKVPPQNWLYDAMISGEEKRMSVEHITLNAIDSALRSFFIKDPKREQKLQLAWATATRLLWPRIELDRELLQQKIFRAISPDGLGSRPSSHAIRGLIRFTVGKSRRYWADLPYGLSVNSYVSHDACSALLCRQAADQASLLWLEGVRCGRKLRLFDRWLSVDALRGYVVKQLPGRWNVLIPESGFISLPNGALKILGDVELPKLQAIRFGSKVNLSAA